MQIVVEGNRTNAGELPLGTVIEYPSSNPGSFFMRTAADKKSASALVCLRTGLLYAFSDSSNYRVVQAKVVVTFS
jgi:hypothetical protein